MSTVAGIDGCPQGWVAARLDASNVEVVVRRKLGEILQALGDCELLAVDTPIGLPDFDSFPRRADLLAREFVGMRRRSVWLTAPRAIYDARYE
jgi:predicted RNase H-like nuclease